MPKLISVNYVKFISRKISYFDYCAASKSFTADISTLQVPFWPRHIEIAGKMECVHFYHTHIDQDNEDQILGYNYAGSDLAGNKYTLLVINS
jgi:hypothetical protein